MKKGAKDKRFFNLKKASSDTKLNDTVNEVEVMSPSEDILSENTKKKKGLDFSKIRKKKKERKQQMEEAYENIYARADLGKYAAAEDVMKLRKMMELTIKGLMNERILEDAFQPEMLYEEILEYLQLSRRLAERSGQPSDEEITEK